MAKRTKRPAPAPGDAAPPDNFQAWALKSLLNRYGERGLLVGFALIGLVALWWNWDTIVGKPGLREISALKGDSAEPPKPKPYAPESELAFSVVARAALPSDPEAEPGDGGLAYDYRQTDKGMAITPRHALHAQLLRGEALSFFPPESWSTVPLLDLRVVNNSRYTLALDDVTLRVETSAPDKRPIPVLDGDPMHMGRLTIANRGWGDMIDVRIDLWAGDGPIKDDYDTYYIGAARYPKGESEQDHDRLAKLEEAYVQSVRIAGPPQYSVAAGTIRGRTTIDLAPLLRKKGARLDLAQGLSDEAYVARRREILGPYFTLDYSAYTSVPIAGTISYRREGDTARERLTFHTTVFVEFAEGGGGLSVSGVYGLELRDEGAAYAVTRPVAISLKAGEADRILLPLSAPTSSFHRFRIAVRHMGKDLWVSDPISLHYLRDRYTIYDPPDRNALASEDMPPISPGRIRSMQSALRYVGLYQGAIDGRMSPATTAAVSCFRAQVEDLGEFALTDPMLAQSVINIAYEGTEAITPCRRGVARP